MKCMLTVFAHSQGIDKYIFSKPLHLKRLLIHFLCGGGRDFVSSCGFDHVSVYKTFQLSETTSKTCCNLKVAGPNAVRELWISVKKVKPKQMSSTAVTPRTLMNHRNLLINLKEQFADGTLHPVLLQLS